MSDTTKTAQPPEAGLYESAAKIYPREVEGRFANLSKLATYVLLGLFYLVPWLMWDDRQAFLFDLPARKFYLLGLTLWPQDFIYLAWLLMILAYSLFFFTALGGRLWCGFACPQTVWTEAFIWMEQWTEGTRSQRMKLDKAPWSFNKFRRKFSKQFLWITFALWTGFTFVGYFQPIRDLGMDILALNVGGWTLFWGLFYGFATYGNAGYMREQVCKYMCPYARFQSAMFDKDTLIISYDEARGEPRGARKKTVDPKQAGLGDCIDCNMCVQVCPTGIDIRDGLQYECIACAACIDVCNDVMDKMNYPRGLVRYTSHNAMEEQQPMRVLRPRVLIYGALLLALLIGFGVKAEMFPVNGWVPEVYAATNRRVAALLAEQRLDDATIVTALLHDWDGDGDGGGPPAAKASVGMAGVNRRSNSSKSDSRTALSRALSCWIAVNLSMVMSRVPSSTATRVRPIRSRSFSSTSQSWA